MKGQIGLVAILGVLVVAVVVIFFAWGSFDSAIAPSAMNQEQKTVKESVDSFIRASAVTALRNVSLYGGYQNPGDYTMGSVELSGKPVPYWQYNGRLNHPSIQPAFFQALNTELRNNRAALEKSLQEEYGEITLGDVSAAGQVLDNQITLTVTMPTSFKGQALPPVYSMAIQTKIGEAFSLAESLAAYLSQDRVLEAVTLDSMISSRLDNGEPTIPFDLTFITGCGNYFYKDWWDIKSWTERAIDVGLGHIYMPGKLPLNVADKVSYLTWGLPAMNGKNYEDLDVDFHTPDDFELEMSTLQFTPNPIFVVPKPIPMSTLCYSEEVYVNYFVTHPAIVTIKDPITNNLLRFALHVYVKDNAPGGWTDVTGYVPSEQQAMCEARDCSTSITVTDTRDSPIAGASVSFLGCPAGKTDSEGVFSSLVPCGGGMLEITAGSRYVQYRKAVTTYTEAGVNELVGLNIALERIPIVTLHFYRVNMENSTVHWTIGGAEGSEAETRPISDTEAVHLTFTDQYGTSYGGPFTGAIGKLEHVPPGNYIVTGLLESPDFTQELGAFSVRETLTEDTTDLYIYLPYTLNFNGLSSDDRIMMTGYLTSALHNCSIGPVSGAEYSGLPVRYWSEETGCN